MAAASRSHESGRSARPGYRPRGQLAVRARLLPAAGGDLSARRQGSRGRTTRAICCTKATWPRRRSDHPSISGNDAASPQAVASSTRDPLDGGPADAGAGWPAEPASSRCHRKGGVRSPPDTDEVRPSRRAGLRAISAKRQDDISTRRSPPVEGRVRVRPERNAPASAKRTQCQSGLAFGVSWW